MTTSPTQQPITADMLWELTRAYPESEQRIWRGAEMVRAGYVERACHGPAGLFLVRSAENPNAAYTVDAYGCSCYDFQKRGGLCKHRAARALYLAAERADAEQTDPTLADEPDPDARYELTGLGYLALVSAAVCTQCHQEAATTRHPDGLGVACIRAELYDDVP